jgi:hypothetical protein
MIGCNGFTGYFCIKWKEGEREQDSGETEREYVQEAEECDERKIASAIRQTLERKQICDANVRLIREIKNAANDVASMICIRSSVCL